MTTLPGLDVSNWQGEVDWTAVRRGGAVFAVCKAFEGTYGPDPTFPRNWSGMASNGLVRGCYHFLRPSMDGLSQAHACHMYVRDHGGMHHHDFVALDIEELDGQTPATVLRQAEAFATYVLHTWRRQCLIYSGPGFWRSLGNPRSKILEGCPLWCADWGVDEPAVFDGWEVVSFWQYTGSGRHSGVRGAVDLDRFMGTRDQLHAVTRPPV